MEFEFSPEERQFQKEVAEYIKIHAAKPGVKVRGSEATRFVDTPARREFMKALAKGGYLGVSWPKEYGGKGLSVRYDYILNEELAYQCAPSTGKGIGIIGRSIMKNGTEAQKKKFLPLILNAEIEWAIGYSEPEAGSDLAALKIKATRDGNGWRINGQKRFTTSAHFADWYWLAVRTDASGPKHKGITLMMLDIKTPGIQINPMWCINEERTNEVFFDNVFVPDDQVVGEVGRAFYTISEALDYERHTLFPFNVVQRVFDMFLTWLRTAKRDGVPLRDDPETKRIVGRLAVQVEAARLHSLHVIASKEGWETAVASAMSKTVGSELLQHLANTILSVMGPQGLLRRDAVGAVDDGLYQMLYRAAVILTVGAGTNEIQRTIIARRGLGLPNPI